MARRPQVSRWTVVPLLAGIALNPLNSSTIAVALVPISHSFHVSVADAAPLLTAYFLTSAMAQSVVGRVADEFGPRMVFLAGFTIAGVGSALALFAPSLDLLLACRVLLALGSAVAYPAAIAAVGRLMPGTRPPAGVLAAITATSAIAAALGPPLGGVVLGLAGWPAVFLLNLPLVTVGALATWRLLPREPERPATDRRFDLRRLAGEIDLGGALLFAIATGSLLAALQPGVWRVPQVELPVGIVALGWLVLHERSAARPLVDLALLRTSRRLQLIYVTFAAISLVFYAGFFGVPVFLEQVRDLNPFLTGIVMMPVSVASIIMSPVAARLMTRYGRGLALVVSALAMMAGCAGLLFFGTATPIWVVLVVVTLLGIPNSGMAVPLQAALFTAVPADRTGSAGGQLATIRYVGASGAGALLALVFPQRASAAGLHVAGAVMAAVAVMVALQLVVDRRGWGWFNG